MCIQTKRIGNDRPCPRSIRDRFLAAIRYIWPLASDNDDLTGLIQKECETHVRATLQPILFDSDSSTSAHLLGGWDSVRDVTRSGTYPQVVRTSHESEAFGNCFLLCLTSRYLAKCEKERCVSSKSSFALRINAIRHRPIRFQNPQSDPQPLGPQ